MVATSKFFYIFPNIQLYWNNIKVCDNHLSCHLLINTTCTLTLSPKQIDA